MKILFIVIDGLADKPIKNLDNKTPLEAAKTPNLDNLAKDGLCGLIEPFQFSGQAYPHSDTAHLALFGYDPNVECLGRGVYETVGIGLRLQKGDVALRVNFATIDDNGKLIDRRAGRIEETQSLVSRLNNMEIEGVRFLLKKSQQHRAGLVLRDISRPGRKRLSSQISGNDPQRTGLKVKKIVALKKNKEARFTAKVLNQFLEKASQVLKNHALNKERAKQKKRPANYLLVRGAGKRAKVESFQKKYHLRAACIAGGGLYKGIGKILGMSVLAVRGADGSFRTNLSGKVLAAKNALNNYDFVFCHIKAADNLAEDGDYLGKKNFLERLDKHLAPILKLKDVLVVVTADHGTCSRLKRHCRMAVPLLIFGNGRDEVAEFSEKACSGGRLGSLAAVNLMPTILKIIQGSDL